MNHNNQSHSSKKRPKIGDLVRLKNGKTTGKLDTIDGNEATIITNGALRIKTKYSNLKKATDANNIQTSSYRTNTINYERKFVEPRLDIHGLRAEEAKKKYLVIWMMPLFPAGMRLKSCMAKERVF